MSVSRRDASWCRGLTDDIIGILPYVRRIVHPCGRSHVAHHPLTADLKSITFEMNVTKTAKSNYLHIVSSVIVQQHCRPVAPKSLSNAAYDLVKQFLPNRVWSSPSSPSPAIAEAHALGVPEPDLSSRCSWRRMITQFPKYQ